MSLRTSEPDLYRLLEGEITRQREGIELIPSENYVSVAVLEAMGTVFTNKYSEGFPRKRYYGGQEFTDQIEQIAIDRAKKLFRCDHANVQPYSGAIANMAAFSSWLELGDTILGMDLSHGGHLTHGHPLTLMATMYRFVRYKMKDTETGEIDYDQLRAVAKKERPKIVLAGFSAYPRELNYARIAEIAKEVDAIAVMDIAHIAGLIAGGVLENPFDHGFDMCTTTTHKTLRGPRGGMILTRGIAGNPLKQPEKKRENLPTLVDRAVFPGVQGGPIMNIVFAKAVAFGEALQPEFAEYARQVVKNAKHLAKHLMKRGFKLITNGTDNHLMLVDMMSSFQMKGKQAESVLDQIGLTLNKNVIPDDPLPPYDPSGIRLGTPAVTTRGMKEQDMETIADWMYRAVTHANDSTYLTKMSAEVREYCIRFKLPSDSSGSDV
ncbi:MAG: serine hydroxymethyltransferase [Patescibacteria group bacterium]|nr:serine hydroxymethyltransferase [Patescibacteria group bacterium]